MDIREFTWDDYAAVRAIWEAVGMWRPAQDSRGPLAVYLAHNPGLFLVATDPAAGGRVVGATLGSFDGRRGYLYHVAVDPAYQGRGVGRGLVHAALGRLWRAGAPKVNLRVNDTNERAIGFYEHLGLHLDRPVLQMSILRPESE